jgi:hypothetical protein
MSVDLSALPQKITLPVGGRHEFALPSYTGSGNSWSIECLRGREVARLSIEQVGLAEILRTPGNGSTEPPELTLTPEVVVISGLAAGESTWRLILARSFGPSTPTASHDVFVTVLPPSR